MFELISHRQVDTEDRMLALQKKNDRFLIVIGYWDVATYADKVYYFLPVTKIRCTISKEIHSRMAHWMGYRFSW